MSETGPYLVIAALCQEWHIDSASHLLTLTGIHNIGIAPRPAGYQVGNVLTLTTPQTLFLRFFGGTPSPPLQLEVRAPSLGVESRVRTLPPLAEAEAMNAVFQLSLAATSPGLHWIEVRLDDRVVTRLPFHLVLPTG